VKAMRSDLMGGGASRATEAETAFALKAAEPSQIQFLQV
jgi:hypothetical protein